jgi:hypothetical protein
MLTLPTCLDVFAAAQQVLSEFGNLHFVTDDSHIILDPSLAEEVCETLKALQTEIGSRLYPLGIIDGGEYMYLIIDENGYIYFLTDILEPYASTFGRAIEFLVGPRIVRKEMEQDLRNAGLFGKVWRVGKNMP